MAPLGEQHIKSLIDAQVFGARGDWEKHEIGGQTSFVKPIATYDVATKARIATRFDELGFVPKFFREHGKEFVAIEAVKEKTHYRTVEEAFVNQILSQSV